MESGGSYPGRVRLSCNLKGWQAISRSLGVTLVLPLFVLMGEFVAGTGSRAPVIYLLSALLVFLNLAGREMVTRKSVGAGGARLQTGAPVGRWLSFSTGWLLTLIFLLTGALLAEGFALRVITLLREHLRLALPAWPWAMGLILVLAIGHLLGTRSRGGDLFLVLISVALLGLALGLVPQVEVENFRASREGGLAALSLLLFVFAGAEIITSYQEEIAPEQRNLARDRLGTHLLIAALGALILALALGVLGVDRLAGARLPLALLGADVLGGVGRPLLLVVGALAMAQALDEVLLIVMRQLYQLSAAGFLPRFLGRVQRRFNTPVLLITLVSLLSLPLVFLPLRFLAPLASLLYLLVLLGDNVALWYHLRSTSASTRLRRWMVGGLILLDLLLLFLWEPAYLLLVLGYLGAGYLLYRLYTRSSQVEDGWGALDEPREALGKSYRILVPLANPATAKSLLDLARVLTKQYGGEILALRVAVVPPQVPLEQGRQQVERSWANLRSVISEERELEGSYHWLTRVARSVPQGILDTAREEEVALILLGWKGYTRSLGASMGPVIDTVIDTAACDVIVVKGEAWEEVERILVPTAGGPHAPIAARLASDLSKVYDAEVTAINVQLGRATPERMEENRQRIAHTLEGLDFYRAPQQKVVIAESVVAGVLQEAEGYDLVLLGASEEGLFDQFVFGSIPQQIAARVPRTAVVGQHFTERVESWGHQLTRSLVNLLPRLNVEEQLELREAMSDGAHPGVSYFVLITLSCIIATLGLLLDSGAVVIGAMLVAPLMSPILAFSLGMVLGDVRLLRSSTEAVFKGVAFAILLAGLTGFLSPFKALTAEILGRTQPTLLDLIVAVVSGMAGAYALARKEVSAALPGVAIAAALMPPLCVVGLGFSFGEPAIVGGAFLLFLTNLASISLAGVLIFLLLGIRPKTWQPGGSQQRLWRRVIGIGLLVLVLALPLAVLLGGVMQDTLRRQTIQEVLSEQMLRRGGSLTGFEYQIQRDDLLIVATVHLPDPLDQEAVNRLAEELEEQLEQSVTLDVVGPPVIRSER